MPATRPADTHGGRPLSEINVTPFVDVMLVLLVIFMVTAPMMQRGVDVRLPEARRAEAISAERVFVTVPLSFRSDRIVQIDEQDVRFDQLSELMQQTLAAGAERSVFLRGDGGITFQELMHVMDELRAGGVEEVGLIADMPSTPAGP